LLPVERCQLIFVTDGQICYEWKHLLAKLKTRDRSRYSLLCSIEVPDVHPLMKVVLGPVEPWEVVR
ncbi:MAG: DNA lyase, partial [Acetomicrobium sp.]|nr:DNA lyase [Acetomicrobium sp.]